MWTYSEIVEKLSSFYCKINCLLILLYDLICEYRRNDPWFAALGRKCIHITWGDRGAISLEVCLLPLPLSIGMGLF